MLALHSPANMLAGIFSAVPGTGYGQGRCELSLGAQLANSKCEIPWRRRSTYEGHKLHLGLREVPSELGF
jgi:hypothetical protein